MELSPSAQRIREVAVEHFAQHGYGGSSLNAIAEVAGMRKASLYSHFAGKDALFLAALRYSAEKEIAHASVTFHDDAGPLQGLAYLSTVGERYGNSASLRFLLRAAYAPPLSLRNEVGEEHRMVLNHIGALFSSALNARGTQRETVLTDAYLGSVDALHVEAIFGDTDLLERRCTALWNVIAAYATAV